ncbi:lysophospholipid acyltransferase family protein [Solemya elarraichensis gill symbiont]|uniref:lysophospholipid acyltransferase family protein n=1 Tax=Solemya elarraichensis gill symbiont TaxID=1918949 RepID=UPI001428A4B6|nr:lysophospholipid acyltransferase family protein [Solemya elarraichensis gill symbiont]
MTLYSHVSLRTAQKIGSLLGLSAWYLQTDERRIAQINLTHCFPEMDPAERTRLAKRSLQESGKLLAEVPLVWLQPASRLSDRVYAEEGMEEIRRIKQSGKGLVLIVPHMGNWEIALSQATKVINMTVLYRPPRQRWLEEVMTLGRQATGAKTAPTNASGIKQLLAALKNGEGVAILPDQAPKKIGGSAAVFAPFFGQPAYTMTLAARLAAKTGAEVRAVHVERLPAGKGFQISLYPVDDAIYGKSTEKSVQAINAAVELCVRKCPEQYQWSYKRFQVQPDGKRSIYSRNKKPKPAN